MTSDIPLYLIAILSGIAFFASVAVALRTKDRHMRKMALMCMMMSAAPATLAPAVLASMKDRQHKPSSSPSPPPKKTLGKPLKIAILVMVVIMLIGSFAIIREMQLDRKELDGYHRRY